MVGDDVLVSLSSFCNGTSPAEIISSPGVLENRGTVRVISAISEYRQPNVGRISLFSKNLCSTIVGFMHLPSTKWVRRGTGENPSTLRMTAKPASAGADRLLLASLFDMAVLRIYELLPGEEKGRREGQLTSVQMQIKRIEGMGCT